MSIWYKIFILYIHHKNIIAFVLHSQNFIAMEERSLGFNNRDIKMHIHDKQKKKYYQLITTMNMKYKMLHQYEDYMYYQNIIVRSCSDNFRIIINCSIISTLISKLFNN